MTVFELPVLQGMLRTADRSLHTLTVDFGNGIVAGTGTSVRILDYDGLASLPTKANVVEHAILNGGVVASIRAGTRRLMFQLDFTETSLGWADVPRLFPQSGPYELTITRDGVTRLVTAYRDSELIPLGNGGVADPVSYQVALLAPDPFLRSPSSGFSKSAVLTGGLTYPVAYPAVYEEIDTSITTGMFDLENTGDYPVGFVFDFCAATTCSPVLSLGEDSMAFGAITSGQRLTVDTNLQTVRINGANAFSLLTGPFLKLPVGSVFITLAGIVGTTTIEFTPVYEAV